MEEVKVCRVCLVTDVRMYDLQSFPYEHYFLTSVGASLSSVHLPQYACYECAALIRKCHSFREKCLKGQAALLEILSTTGVITLQSLEHIDRLNLKLESNLHEYHSLNEDCVYYFTHEDEVIHNVKNEPETDNKYDIEIDPESIKEELSFDVPSPVRFGSDDDDEPLSFHKSNKDKKVKKKSEKKRGRRKKESEDDKQLLADIHKANVEASEDITELLPILEGATQKRKRGRPRKNGNLEEKSKKQRRTNNTGGVNPEDFNLEEYVTIVELSLEEQIEEVQKRQQTSNYQNAPFQCNLCYRGFIDTQAWKHHVGKHDSFVEELRKMKNNFSRTRACQSCSHHNTSGDIECVVCKFRFKTKRTLQKHASTHEKKYKCKSCSYVSKTTTQAKQHQRWHKGVTYKCQHCDEVSTKWTSYLSHVRIKHPSEFICDVCGYSYVSKLGLTMHRTMMHKDVAEKQANGSLNDEGPYCVECNVKFISEEGYKRHMVTSIKHIQATNLKSGCRACGAVFSNAEELRVHHRREHARPRPRNYGKKPSLTAFPAKCDHCSEEMCNARQYWAHFRRAHPDKNYPIQKDYVCDVCGKSFRGNAFLVYHKRTHQEERAFKCSQCPKAFFNRTNLLMHERTHSDTRPYPCSVCFKAFKCKGALDRHFRSHTGVKPYECEVCGKAFGQSNSRKLHVRTVHLKQPAPYVSRARLERRGRARDANAHFMY